jgi:hypothetical protein
MFSPWRELRGHTGPVRHRFQNAAWPAAGADCIYVGGPGLASRLADHVFAARLQNSNRRGSPRRLSTKAPVRLANGQPYWKLLWPQREMSLLLGPDRPELAMDVPSDFLQKSHFFIE